MSVLKPTQLNKMKKYIKIYIKQNPFNPSTIDYFLFL